jgi:5'(3')-deoxyribonucleotidase
VSLAVVCDVDGVLADFNGALSKALAAEGCLHPAGRPYQDDDFTQWELLKCIEPAHHGHLERISYRQGFCSSIQRYDGAQRFYRSLQKHGRVLAVTTSWKGPSWDQERYEWLVSFGFADPEIHLVKNHAEKHAVPCDVVIEDRLETLQSWPAGPMRVLVDRPWNRQSEQRDQDQAIMRAYSYAHVIAFVKAKENMVAHANP